MIVVQSYIDRVRKKFIAWLCLHAPAESLGDAEVDESTRLFVESWSEHHRALIRRVVARSLLLCEPDKRRRLHIEG